MSFPAVSDCLRDRFQAMAPPALCMSELTPDGAALHPSQLEPEQGCDVGALPT